jgi:hypothetical protein
VYCGYIVHSPNDQSPNDQSSNDYSLNDQSLNDQSPEQLKCDQSPNATISQMTIFRTANLRMRYILGSVPVAIVSVNMDLAQQGSDSLAGSGFGTLAGL